MSIWQPGPRPDWVRALHQISEPSWVRLDADEIADEARQRAGLSDFGGDAFWEPYRIFVAALEQEAKLHTLGRLIARDDLLNWLQNRLEMTEWRNRHPEIGEQAVARPIFITGLPRTGTSILHELLARHPRHRAPLHWEVRHPCPPPETGSYATDERIARADRQARFWAEIVPEYDRMHELGGTIPVECIQITAHEFRSDELMGRHIVPSYAAWFAQCDLVPAYEFHRRMLQHLSRRCWPSIPTHASSSRTGIPCACCPRWPASSTPRPSCARTRWIPTPSWAGSRARPAPRSSTA